MSAVVRYADAQKRMTEAEYKEFISNQNRWQLIVNGEKLPPGTDFSFTSKFGEVKSAVVLSPEGKAVFDRPAYIEAPFAQVVVWGKGADGSYYYGMVDQARPHADEPGEDRRGKDGHDAVRFLHVIMGFNEQAATGKFETPEAAAKREANEEGGAGSAVLNVKVYGLHNPSPSFTPTWGSVVGVEVDLEKLEHPVPDPDEPINGVYFIEGNDLLDIIARGGVDGAHTGVCTSLSALMIHWAHHPEQFPR